MLILNLGTLLLFILPTLHAKGTIYLDSLVFDKIISKFKATLVKFDVAYPYGNQHEQYIKFAESVFNVDDLLVAEVGVKDYGEKDNEDLALRFNIVKEDFPVVKLFVQGKEEPYTLETTKDEEFTIDKLRSFVKRNSGEIYVGAPGCIQSYDTIAKKFASQSSPEIRKKLLLDAEKLWDSATGNQEQKSAEVYVKTMRKILDKGNEFVNLERERIYKVLKGDLSDTKRTDLNNRINILDSFTVLRDEL